MLGSPSEADDAVQEAWLRLSRADAGRAARLRAAWPVRRALRRDRGHPGTFPERLRQLDLAIPDD
jgi:DNA-directed RNA polymerase specialized sigma24 family protein